MLVAGSIGEAHRQFITQHAFLGHHQPDQLFVAFFTLHFQRFTTDKVAVSRFPCDGPAHVGRQRRNAFVHLLTVQVHTGFQTQRVTCAETAGFDTSLYQRTPEICRFFIRHGNFIACFAGITGGCDKQVARLNAEERLHACYRLTLLVSKQRSCFFLCVWTLYRNQRQVVTNGDVDSVWFSVLGNPGEVFFAGGGVYNEAEEPVFVSFATSFASR